jgi:hypothetical protein
MENYYAKTSTINEAFGLPEWNEYDTLKVKGDLMKTYYLRSRWATIEAYEKGFLVYNCVVGTKHYCETWNKAKELRQRLSDRYTAIERF